VTAGERTEKKLAPAGRSTKTGEKKVDYKRIERTQNVTGWGRPKAYTKVGDGLRKMKQWWRHRA